MPCTSALMVVTSTQRKYDTLPLFFSPLTKQQYTVCALMNPNTIMDTVLWTDKKLDNVIVLAWGMQRLWFPWRTSKFIWSDTGQFSTLPQSLNEAAQTVFLELLRLSNKSGVKTICKSLHPVLIFIWFGIPAYLERGLYMKNIDGYPLSRGHEPACWIQCTAKYYFCLKKRTEWQNLYTDKN